MSDLHEQPDGLMFADGVESAELATQKWGWRQTGRETFENQDRKRIAYVPVTGGLALYRFRSPGQPMPVYLGHKWEERGDARQIQAFIDLGRFKVMDPWAVEFGL